MKPKIAFFVINHTSGGGVERVTSSLISIFDNANFIVHSLISTGDCKLAPSMISPSKQSKLKCINRKNIAVELPIYLTKEKITHLIFQGDNMTISKAILNATKEITCKAYLHYHGSPFSYLKKNLYLSDFLEKPINIFKLVFAKTVYPFKKRKLLSVIKNSTDGFITVSNGARKEIEQLYNKEFKNITTIHNPISFSNTNEIDVSEKEPIVVYISRLERKDKNALIAIKAWKQIASTANGWKFIILGDGKLRSKMEMYAHKHDIKNVEFHGYSNNVLDYLKKSSISILVSDSEGFGMGIFESLGCKNAIISTKSYGGIVDLVKDGTNGFLVKKNDYKAVAKKISILIKDNTLRKKMGQNSFNIYQKIENENIPKQWFDLLKLNRTKTASF